MFKSKSLVVALALLSAVGAQASTAVLPPKSLNLAPTQAEVVGLLLARHYAAASGQPVIEPDAVVKAAQGGDLFEAARRLGATEVLETVAVGLEDNAGEKELLVSVVRKTIDGAVVHQAEMRATSLKDVQGVAERLAQALAKRLAPEATRTHENVTETETELTPRLSTEKVVGLKLGLVVPQSSGHSYRPLGALSFDARLERSQYFIETGAGLLIPGPDERDNSNRSYGGLFAEVGASAYLMKTDSAPYVGGGMLGRIIFASESGVNMAPYVQVGLMFSREASTRLYADFRVAQNVLPVVTSSTGKGSYPTELGINVGIGW